MPTSQYVHRIPPEICYFFLPVILTYFSSDDIEKTGTAKQGHIPLSQSYIDRDLSDWHAILWDKFKIRDRRTSHFREKFACHFRLWTTHGSDSADKSTLKSFIVCFSPWKCLLSYYLLTTALSSTSTRHVCVFQVFTLLHLYAGFAIVHLPLTQETLECQHCYKHITTHRLGSFTEVFIIFYGHFWGCCPHQQTWTCGQCEHSFVVTLVVWV